MICGFLRRGKDRLLPYKSKRESKIKYNGCVSRILFQVAMSIESHRLY